MELIAFLLLIVGWIRLSAWFGFRTQLSLISSLVLAVVSWLVIVESIAFVLNSPMLTVSLFIGLLGLGLGWPGGRFVHFLKRRPMLR